MSHQISLDTLISRSEHNLSSNLAGEEVVLDLVGGVYYGLNEAGAQVWSLLETPQTPRLLCETLAQEYDVDRAVLESDVLALLHDMETEGLIEVHAAAEEQ